MSDAICLLYLLPTMVVWLVADSEAISYQDTQDFNKSKNLETYTATAINYTTCYGQVLFINSSK